MNTDGLRMVGVAGTLGASMLLAFACATGDHPNQFPGAVTFATDSTTGSGTEGETECLPEDGWVWCTRRENAYYIDPPDAIHVLYPQLDPPEGCTCVPNEIHDVLFGLLMSGEVPESSLNDGADLEAVKDEIYDDSAAECLELVPLDMPGGDPLQNDCEAESSIDTDPGTGGTQWPGIYIGNRNGEQTCTFERCYEELVDPGICSFMDGSYDVTLSHGVYEIGEELFDDVLAYPGCLLWEPGRVVDAQGGGYKLSGITAGDLLDELGLNNGDKPKKLNGEFITTVNNLYAVYDDLRRREETEFSLVVSRCGILCSDVTLNYEVLP